MNEKKGYKIVKLNISLNELRQGSCKYLESIIKVLEKIDKQDASSLAKDMTFLGYAIGVIAGKLSDEGIGGFQIILNAIKISLNGEKRKEEINYAIWDKDGTLWTSEEAFRMQEGGEE